MERVVSLFEFLPDSKVWAGNVSVLEVSDEDGTKHIYLRLRVGRVTLKLPRSGLNEVIDALVKAEASSKQHYAKLIEQMNRGIENGGL